MPPSQRIVLGHAVMGLGLALRRLSLPLSALAALVLAGWSVVHEATERGGFPNLIPFHAGARVGLVSWVLGGIVAVIALLLALRLLAFMIGGVGWSVLPAEHREVLGRLSAPSSHSGRKDPPDSGATFAVSGVPLS